MKPGICLGFQRHIKTVMAQSVGATNFPKHRPLGERSFPLMSLLSLQQLECPLIICATMVFSFLHTEVLFLKKCAMGFGRCKNVCTAEEKEIQKCKKKRCCLEARVVQFLKSYLRNQVPHVIGDDIPEMLKINRGFAKIKTKHVFPIPTRNSTQPSAGIDAVVTPKTMPMTPHSITAYPISAKNDTKKSVRSVNALPPPPP